MIRLSFYSKGLIWGSLVFMFAFVLLMIMTGELILIGITLFAFFLYVIQWSFSNFVYFDGDSTFLIKHLFKRTKRFTIDDFVGFEDVFTLTSVVAIRFRERKRFWFTGSCAKKLNKKLNRKQLLKYAGMD